MDGVIADQVVLLDGEGEGEGRTPLLALDGFRGPLEHLLALARAQQIDLVSISLVDLVDQLAMALQRAPTAMPLGQKGDWVVMVSWLLQLRSRLLLPADGQAHQAVIDEVDRLRGRLLGLQEMQALAAWLDRRPQLSQDVFARGQPELLGTSVETDYEVDVIEFLWASLNLFDDDLPDVDTGASYRPGWLDLHSIPDARARILRLLAETPEGQGLDRLLPVRAEGLGEGAQPRFRQRSAWSSTFIASLELAKQGDVTLTQEDVFGPIHVCRTPVGNVG